MRLLSHEVAHAVQQSGGSDVVRAMSGNAVQLKKDPTPYTRGPQELLAGLRPVIEKERRTQAAIAMLFAGHQYPPDHTRHMSASLATAQTEAIGALKTRILAVPGATAIPQGTAQIVSTDHETPTSRTSLQTHANALNWTIQTFIPKVGTTTGRAALEKMYAKGLSKDLSWQYETTFTPTGAIGPAPVVKLPGTTIGPPHPGPPNLSGKKVGIWSDSTDSQIVALGPFIKNPGYDTQTQAEAIASMAIVDFNRKNNRQAHGLAIIHRKGRYFVFRVHVQSLTEFSRKNLEDGDDQLTRTRTAVRSFITNDGYIAPVTQSSGSVRGIVDLTRVNASHKATAVPSKQGIVGVAAVVRAGLITPARGGDEFLVINFQNLIRRLALDHLDDNQALLAGLRNKYGTPSDTDPAWKNLRQIIEADQRLATGAKKAQQHTMGLRARQHAINAFGAATAGYADEVKNDLSASIAHHKDINQARTTLRKIYPALALIDVDDIDIYTSTKAINTDLVNAFDDLEEALSDLRVSVHEGDITLTRMGPVVDEALSLLAVDKNAAASGDRLSTALLGWLAKQNRDEHIVQFMLLGVEVALTVGAIFTTGPLALFLAIAGTGVGIGTAAYEFEDAADVDTAANASKIGAAFVNDPSGARVKYLMAWVNLLLSGVDVLEGVGAASKLSGLAAAEKLAGRWGGKRLAQLDPEMIRKFEHAVQLRGAGNSAKADEIFEGLRKQMDPDEFQQARAFMERAAHSGVKPDPSVMVREAALPPRALASTPSLFGEHVLWMDANGAIFRCSPSCTTLRMLYDKQLADPSNWLIRRDLEALEKEAARAAAAGSPARAKELLESTATLEARLKHAKGGGNVTHLQSMEEVADQVKFAHDAGVKHGRSFAKSAAGGNLQDVNFKNPFDTPQYGPYGQGFDDIMANGKDLDTATIYILEYKGGTAGLKPGQMELDWVQRNICRLANEGGAAGLKWSKILLKALREGRLRGVATSTKLVNRAAQPPTKIQEWNYANPRGACP